MKASIRFPSPIARASRWNVGLGLVLGWMLLPWLLASAQQPPTTGEYQVYPLRHKPAGEIERLLGDVLRQYGAEAQVVADGRNNQILLRGPVAAQQTARTLIDAVDRPTAATANPMPAGAPAGAAASMPAPHGSLAVRTHACVPGRQAEIAEQLRVFYASRQDVRIASDPIQPQIFVFGPADVQDTVARQLAVMAGVAASGGEAAGTGVESPRQEQFIPLKHVRAEQIEPILSRLLGARLARSATPVAGASDYVFADFSGRRLEIRVDRQRNGLALNGPESLAAQFLRLVTSLDEPGQSPGQALRIMPVRKADPAKVEEAVRAYQSGRTTPQPAPLPNDSGRVGPNGQGAIGLVAYAADAAAAQSGVKAIPATEGKEEQTRRLLRAIGSDVEVEMLPDLDVIILRGRDRDVDEVTKIIEELERLSVETQPVVEVYPLKHIGGESLVTVVAKVQDMIIGGRQGRVSVIPLVRPNALLMIGWGEAVKAVKDVIEKIDQPTAPETQFRVFPLKYAPVGTASRTVQEFFAGRTGLNAKVLVSADARTNSLLVQAPPQEMVEVASLVEGLDRSQSAAVNQTRIFKLKYSLATDLATTLQAAISASRTSATGTTTTSSAGQKSATLELLTVDAQGQKVLRSGVLSDVQITADPRLNTLIITGPAESMDLLGALIQQLDAPVSAAQIKVFRVVNGDAASLVQMLRSLLPSATTTSTATVSAAAPPLSVSADETSLVPLRFSIDVRTNSIIVVGATGDLKIVEALLLRLDEEDVQQRKSEIYRLKNSPALDVATAINEFLRSKRQVEQAATGAVSPFQQIEAEVVVVPEPVSNSLVISATPRFFNEIKELVEKLDAQPPQVLIQVMIAAVDLQNFNEFGVELGLQDSLLFDRSLLGNLLTTTSSTQTPSGNTVVTSTQQNIIAASNAPGFAFNNQDLGNSGSTNALKTSNLAAGQALSSFNLGRKNTERSYGGLVLSASSESVSVLIRALQETRCLEVLARPQIMTLDNQPAYIQVGQRVPRIAGTAVTQATQVNSIVLENVGLILGVTPRISPDGLVVMEIDAERSKLGAEADGVPVSVSQGTVIRSPAIDLATAQTTVSAQSGETIVLAGLITKEKEKIDRKVPLLADIPVLGSLFRYKSDDNRRSELLIVLTPHVIRTPEEAERAKQIEAAKMHWCLRDVEAIQGPIGVASNGDLAPQAPVIYPDSNPRGILPVPPPPAPIKAPNEGKPDAIMVPLPPPADGTSEAPWPAPLPNGRAVSPAVPLPDTARSAATPDSRSMYIAPGYSQNAQGVLPVAHLEKTSR